MKNIQPVRVTYINGNVEHNSVDMYNLPTFLGTLDMSRVAGIEYGEALIKTGFATTIKRSDVDVNFHGGEFHLDMHTEDGKRVTTVKYSPVQLQKFALDMLQQTYYKFEDAAYRLEGLDK